jgi:hypothetical protein
MTAPSYAEQHDAWALPPRRLAVSVRPYTGMSERQSRPTSEEHSLVRRPVAARVNRFKKNLLCDSVQSNQYLSTCHKVMFCA